VESFSVVEDLDVFEDLYCSRSLIFKFGAINSLRFQALEEAFSHCVIPAVGPAAHALANQGISPKLPSELVTGVLHPSVRCTPLSE